MTKKRGVQVREKKDLSAKGLLKIVRGKFQEIPEWGKKKTGRIRNIDLVDELMSALAMFSLKYPTLLAFDRAKKDPIIKNNLKNLYGINNPPSDTYMRQELDKVDPALLRESFLMVFAAVQRGKLLENYRFLDGYLLAIDGTSFFKSDCVHCSDCCVKEHRDGRISYYHQVLGAVIAHPDHRQVIPLCPELISKQDGSDKNDCERRAAQRFFVLLKKEHPLLKLTVLFDALSANAPTIHDITSYGHHYIINAKPGSNKSLFEWVDGLDLEETTIVVGQNKYVFRFINGIPLNDTKDAPLVNFLECKAREIDGKKVKEKTFTWITDQKISKDNAYLIMRGGRTRWKIENETYNTLKNQGYQFEHNFGHGKKHLTSVFALLMMLAFLIDQIQEAACGLFQTALATVEVRRDLWERIRCYFFTYFVNSWEDLFVAIHKRIVVVLSVDGT